MTPALLQKLSIYIEKKDPRFLKIYIVANVAFLFYLIVSAFVANIADLQRHFASLLPGFMLSSALALFGIKFLILRFKHLADGLDRSLYKANWHYYAAVSVVWFNAVFSSIWVLFTLAMVILVFIGSLGPFLNK